MKNTLGGGKKGQSICSLFIVRQTIAYYILFLTLNLYCKYNNDKLIDLVAEARFYCRGLPVLTSFVFRFCHRTLHCSVFVTPSKVTVARSRLAPGNLGALLIDDLILAI